MRIDLSGFDDPAMAWLVVNTHPHRERLAVENLERQGFAIYCPLIRKRLRSRSGPTDVRRPLFPSYLFVRVARNARLWRPILSTYGVRRVVRFGEEASYLDNAFIESLRGREVDGAIVRPEAPYEVGQEIRISGGPFDGIVARIVEAREKDRLVILMDLLNGAVRARVSVDQVSPFKAA